MVIPKRTPWIVLSAICAISIGLNVFHYLPRGNDDSQELDAAVSTGPLEGAAPRVLEEEEHVSAPDFAYSFMLILSVTFQLCIFYFVNWPDADIRAYAWDTIGNTILIFSGVLTFAACNGITNAYFVHFHPGYHAVIKFIQFLFFCFMMQVVIAWCSGYFRGKGQKRTKLNTKTMQLVEVSKEEYKEEKLKANECYASLMAHITGFAAIHFFGYLQHIEPFKKTPLWALSSSLVALVGCLIVFKAGTLVRDLVVDRNRFHTTLEIWQDVSREKNHDVAGIVCSSLAFLAIRFTITDKLANVDGDVMVEGGLALDELWKLCIVCTCWVFASMFMLWFHFQSGYINFKEERQMLTRISIIAQNVCNMSVSWSCLVNAKLFVTWMNWFEDGECIAARISVAYGITFGAFVVIYILDKISDFMRDRGTDVDCMTQIIRAIGLAIGFAWEQSFDKAVDDLGARVQQKLEFSEKYCAVVKLMMAVGLVGVVLPAYRFYIAPYVEAADDEQKEENAEIKQTLSEKLLKA